MTVEAFDQTRHEQQLSVVRQLMKTEGRWFEDGHNYDFRPATTRRIVLGRHEFYVQIADFLFEQYGMRSYLLDFMAHLEDGLETLLFYIESAERIDINLEGVKPGHLRQATIGIGKLASHLREIEAPHATGWEINQVFHKGLIEKTWFHTGSAMSRRQAYRAMGKRVPMQRILNDNRRLLGQYRREIAHLPELEESC
jgi:hypothetical protein